MHSRQVSTPLLHLLLTLTYPDLAQPSPLASATLESPHKRSPQLGSTTIHNNCSFPVYLWSVADSASPAFTLSPDGSGTHTEPFQQRANGGGVSMKASDEDDIGSSISQLEYTVVPDGLYVGVFWDLSHVNGNPFQEYGEEVVPLASSGDEALGSCTPVSCAGAGVCQEAYTQPDDNWATHECGLETELLWTVCSGN